MARRRFKRRATSRRSPMRIFRRRRSGSSSGSSKGLLLGAVAYGAFREKISNMLTPITARIPLGNITDEVALGVLAYYGQKKLSNPMLKNVCKAALTIEAARIGEALISGSMFNTGSTNAMYLYG